MGAPVASVVDYAAWEKGYMPPSEHRLIHALSHEGAKVRASSEVVRGSGWWIVTKGDAFDSEDMWEMIEFVTERCGASPITVRAPSLRPAKSRWPSRTGRVGNGVRE